VYRSFVHLLSITILRDKTIHNLAKKYNIKIYKVSSRRELERVVKLSKLGFAFNFDLILSESILDKFELGVYNIHASKLPEDRGISPVVWAFGRGDNSVWSTIYKMDDGVDTGEICKQFEISVEDSDTCFSLYKKVSIRSEAILSSLVEKILQGKVELRPQKKDLNSNYCSWPDEEFSKMMRNSNRKIMRFSDLKKNNLLSENILKFDRP
tara:strand:- start:163 stop:792 length:630 start_codon:yes stop_codon:yes gene_type:complete